MPQKNEASGRRSVEMEIELPGTPERVWQAIATGSRLFCLVPADGFIEGREDGAVRVSIATGVTSQGHVTVLRTPFRFAYEGIERIE